MPEQIFIGLSVIIGSVLVTLGVMKILKQPMIIGYILAGTLLSIFLPDLLHNNHAIESFSSIGIAFLLFIVGMELNPKILKDLGKTSLIAGISQVLITAGAGFGISLALGFDYMTAFYIGIGFAFSSTIVVLKLLGDKGDTDSVHGRLSVGILIVQDLVVMLLFLVLAAIKNAGDQGGLSVILLIIAKMIVLGGGLFVISKYIIPKITKKIAESQEYLFLFAIGWCMVLGSLFQRLGFGIEIGALVAGITLATSSYRFEIISRIKSLKDFFVIMFFVLLGSHVDFGSIGSVLPAVIILSLFVLIIKPLIIMVILGLMKHTKKNNFLAGTSLAQISEFSFILIGMGIASQAITDSNILSIITMVGLISITGSSYYSIYGNKLYHTLRKIIKYLPGKKKKKYHKNKKYDHEVVLFGFGRFGSKIYDSLKKLEKKTLVIEENPSIIKHLEKQKISNLYGDGGDFNFLEELDIKETKMMISSIRNFDDTMLLLKVLKRKNPNLITILLSNRVEEAIKLYDEGADYVILPHHIGADHTSLLLEEFGFNMEKFLQNKVNQVHKLRNTNKDMLIEALQKVK